jgi:heme/copper-type cytochrome/quinol oxidase subunit 2
MTMLAFLVGLRVASAPMEEGAGPGMEPALSSWFIIYVIVMTTAAVLGVLLLIVILNVKLSRISKQLNQISESTTTFIRVGLDHFRDLVGKHGDRRS